MHDRFYMQLRIALHLLFIASIAIILVGWSQFGALKTVGLEVDGSVTFQETRHIRVGAFLTEMGVQLGPSDMVEPPLEATLSKDETVRVTRAVPVVVAREGSVLGFYTTAFSVRDALQEAGISMGAYDVVALDGRLLSPQALLREQRRVFARIAGLETVPLARPDSARRPEIAPLFLAVQQARPVYVHDSGFVVEVHTIRPILQETLAAAGIDMSPGDISLPGLATPVSAGQHVYLLRAKELHVHVDGTERTIYTFVETVGEVLEEAGIQLAPPDKIDPPLAAVVQHETTITVVRVSESRITLDEPIPHATQYVADDTLEIDQKTLVQRGAPGVRKRQIRIHYEDGSELRHVEEKVWVETKPLATIVHYGTKAVLRTLETPSGPVEYWRKLRVYATWYNPASSGKPPGHPAYGITRTGTGVYRGIIAVDPRVIPLYSRLYVPGYGPGLAADTGGGIIGNWIDLGFADDEQPDWNTGWTDVYLLGPAPDPSEVQPPVS